MMAKSKISRRTTTSTSTLKVRLDLVSKACLRQAAELRRISMSDYVRMVMVPQARREVEAAKRQTISLSPDEQLAFWRALQAPTRLTAAQSRLGTLMRREE
jgi:uncharacterized protein (DUF1778 family)